MFHPSSLLFLDSYWFILIQLDWYFCSAIYLEYSINKKCKNMLVFSQIFPTHRAPDWGLRTTNASTLRHELARFLKDNPKLEIAGDTLEDLGALEAWEPGSGLSAQPLEIWGKLQLFNSIVWFCIMIYIYIHINIYIYIHIYIYTYIYI